MQTEFTPSAVSAEQQQGFGLVELMIALVISLILIGGAISVFLSNQQTYRAKQGLDEAQETFRFGSQTIMRVVRQGAEICTSSNDEVLRVRMQGDVNSGIRDCLGGQVEQANVVSEFRLAGNELVCRVFTDNSAGCDAGGGDDAVLVAGIETAQFRYSGSGTYWEESVRDGNSLVTSSEWEDSPSGDSRSVAVRLQMENSGLASIFTATSRTLTVEQ